MKQRFRKRFSKGEDGVAMVEFAILIIVLLLILLGIIQFGLLWFTKYTIDAAAREGARYATCYTTAVANNKVSRVVPSQLTNPTVKEVVQNYVNKLIKTPVDFTPSGPGWNNGTSGLDVTITVSCNNPWNLLGGFIPSLNNLTLQSQVTMKNE